MQLQPFEYLGRDTRQWNFNDFRVTFTYYPGAQQQPRHRHENSTFFFLLGGGFVDDSDELGSRSPNRFDLLYHPSGSWHESRASQEGRVGLNLEPNDRWLAQFGLTPSELGQYRLESDPVKSSELLRLLCNGFQEPDVDAQLLEIILPPTEANPKEQPWQRKLAEIVREDRSLRWSLKSLAKELAVHPVYLARVFRAQYGCSLTTYLLRRRLMRCAQSLLAGRALMDVVFENGFADQSHFTRSFRSFFGVSPTEFQRKWLQLF